MAYVQPNTIIEVMNNIPITPSYNDTLYFGSYNDQNVYFTSMVKYTFSNQMYQRVNKNTCRVEKNAENLYDCNYMRFKNYAYGNKWFYAFINHVEYINDNVSEITYEIDELQTWFFDMQLGQCFVEREHVTDDTVGLHILPEPVDVGDSICSYSVAGGYNNLSLVLLRSRQNDTALIPGGLRDGIYVDCETYVFPFTAEGDTRLTSLLNEIYQETGGIDTIIGCYLAPTEFIASQTDFPKTVVKTLNKPTTIGSFVPHNNKLLTFPYSYMCVDCINDTQIYKYERFTQSTTQISFEICGCVIGTPSVLCAPKGYELNDGVTQGKTDYVHQVVMSGYPMCAINVDVFKQWLANNFISIAGNVAASATGAAVSAAMTTSAFGFVGGLIGIGKTLSDIALESQRGNTARGAINNNINAQNRSKDFYFKYMGLPYEKAKSLDDFFDRYGYTCERVKVPNINARQNWTYTKTRGCVVKGSLPASSARKIADIFDHGITFWKSAVGDYSLSNGVLT